jgi:bifunctional UDP-N-acetylglucosamine pyrophosphorylase/glucosamine-1-phosphate N-acetyltransferase
VPAAGSGSRLGSPLPKLLTPVAGRAMIDHVLHRHQATVQAAVIVVQPEARSEVANHLRVAPLSCVLAEQKRPTGMLDAILAAWTPVMATQPERVRITWCDQVGISAATVETLTSLELTHPGYAVIMPTVQQPSPYIHFDRDPAGRLAAVRHRREGDDMPDMGTSDAGLFSLSREAFERWLPEYAAAAEIGANTGERNFLPFIPWVATRASVRTFDIAATEAQGINTPEDLASVESRLRSSQDGPQ